MITFDKSSPFIVIYKYIVEGLLQSPPKDAHVMVLLQRDRDPQVFENFLSEVVTNSTNGSQLLLLSDIALIDEEQGFEQHQTLRPYVLFNLQRHMIEKVQGYIDNCILYLPSDHDDDCNVIKYQMKSDIFHMK